MAEKTVIYLKNASFNKEVKDSETPVIVDFYADWCGPCNMMAPVFEQLSKEYEGRLKFAKIDVDTNQGISEEYNVRSIPTLIFFNKGEEIGRFMGYRQKENLKSDIDNTLKGLKD